MTEHELNILLSRGEDIHTEFKEAKEKAPQALYETVCSFLNKEGGTIILGIDDDAKIKGINPSEIDQIKKDVVTAINNKDIINPPVNFPVTDVEKDGNKLLYIRIPVSSQVHTYKGIIYDREHDSDIRIIDDDRISEIYFRKRQSFSENEIYSALTMDDLDSKLFDKARALIRSVNSTHPWLEEDNLTILRRALLYRKDFKTGKEGLTLAAALIFGKDETIQSILPAYKVEAIVRRENLDRWDDRITLRTNLIDTYQQLMLFVKKHLPDKFYLENDQRKDLRELIFREIIGNIIVHREYTSQKSSDFIIYKDKVEATNPNKVVFRGILQLDTFSPYPKNPNIRKFFTEFRWTDEIGSGVKNVNKFLKLYTGGAKPLFIEDDDFKTVIPLLVYKFDEKADVFFDLLGINSEIIPKECSDELKNLALSEEYAKLINPDEFFFKKGSGWDKKGVKLKNVRFQITSKLSFDDFQKGSSWSEKGVKLFSKRSLNILKIMVRVLTPATIDELMEFMEFGSRDKLRELYLNPLRKDGLVELTVKDKPNAPNQKYIITEKGKLFLGGFDI